MSYLRGLDGVEERLLREEIGRRVMRRNEGLCDYCGRSFNSTPCRMKERHERCGAVSLNARGVRDGRVCTAPRGHPQSHHSEDGAAWSTEASR